MLIKQQIIKKEGLRSINTILSIKSNTILSIRSKERACNKEF